MSSKSTVYALITSYNKRTFEKFMRDVNQKYNERISINKKLRYEVEMQINEATRPVSKEYPNPVYLLPGPRIYA